MCKLSLTPINILAAFLLIAGYSFCYLSAAADSIVPEDEAAARAVIDRTCLEQDRELKLVLANRKIDVVKLYALAVVKFEIADMTRSADPRLAKYGVTSSDPRQWAQFFVKLCQTESGCNVTIINNDGTLQKFRSTPPGENSYGPLQYNIGQYGLSTWDMVNSPSCSLDAFIKTAKKGKLFEYFGPLKRGESLRSNSGSEPIPWSGNQIPPGLTQQGPLQAIQKMLGSTLPTMPTSASASGSGGRGNSPSQSTGMPTTQPTQVIPTGAVGATGASAPAPAIGGISVQPKKPARGKTLTVSWATVNMKDPSCKVTVNDAPVSDGNNGTKTYYLRPEDIGTLLFNLTCTAQNGNPFGATDTVVVQ